MIDLKAEADIQAFDPGRASRIAQALRMAGDKGVKQADIARSCGVSPQAVYRWKKTGQISLNHLLKLASLSGASKDWLADGSGPSQDGVVPEKRHLIAVPLISSIAAGEMCESPDLYHAGDAEEWVETTARVSPKAYALRVIGDSMTNPHGAPSIPEGSIVIIDPAAEPMPGKIIVVKVRGEDDATLKRLIKDGPHYYLKPLNPAYPIFELTEKHIICGVAKQIVQEL